MAEWSIAAVLKTVEAQVSGGSNPSPSASFRLTPIMKKVRIGIIGCGVISATHIECYRAIPGVEVTWLCDLRDDRLADRAAKYGVRKTTRDAAEVFAARDVDAVSICTDHASHAALCLAALDAGKDVLCEKILANNRANLRRMVAAAGAHPERVFGAVFQHRFDPVNIRMREILASGALGRLLTAGVQLRCYRSDDYYRGDDWRGTWKLEGGSILVNQAIHFIDQLLWQVDSPATPLGFHANLAHRGVIETEDTAVAALRFRNGALGTLEATCGSNLNWESTLSYHGTLGSIDLRDDKPLKVEFRDAATAERIRAELAEATAPKHGVSGKTYYGTGHMAQLHDFVEAVRTRRPPAVTVPDAAKTASFIFDIYASQKRRAAR